MSIIERTTKLLLTQFKGSSIKPAYLEYYTADMKKLDDYATGADARLSALEAEDVSLDRRLDTLEGWKTDTVDPALTSYDSRLDAIEAVIENVSDQNIRDLMERLAALEEKVAANTEAIDGHSTRIDALEDSFTELQNEIRANAADIVALGRRITVLENCCETVQGHLTTIDSTLLEHAGLISGLRTDVDRNTLNIQANAEDITILAGQINTINQNVNSLLNDMDVQHIVEFASVNTQSLTAKGLTFSFVSEGGWCHVAISGTLSAAIVDDETWTEVVPEGFVPATNVYSSAVQPATIANNLVSIVLEDDGDISAKCVSTVAIGTAINQTIDYPLAQPTEP